MSTLEITLHICNWFSLTFFNIWLINWRLLIPTVIWLINVYLFSFTHAFIVVLAVFRFLDLFLQVWFFNLFNNSSFYEFKLILFLWWLTSILLWAFFQLLRLLILVNWIMLLLIDVIKIHFLISDRNLNDFLCITQIITFFIILIIILLMILFLFKLIVVRWAIVSDVFFFFVELLQVCLHLVNLLLVEVLLIKVAGVDWVRWRWKHLWVDLFRSVLIDCASSASFFQRVLWVKVGSISHKIWAFLCLERSVVLVKLVLCRIVDLLYLT